MKRVGVFARLVQRVSASKTDISNSYLYGNSGDFIYEGQKGTLKGAIVHFMPDLPSAELDGWTAFLSRCLQIQPENRPTAAELLQDPWISED
jgi:serine/threonine protein kinase